MSDPNPPTLPAASPAATGDRLAQQPSPPPADLHDESSTIPNPPATPARTDTGFPQHQPHPFHSTPLRPSPNPWHLDPDTGKARRIGLVDDTGMGTRFHQLGLNTFNDIIPGDLPSDEDRKRFLKPDIGNQETLEHDIGVELTKTIKSILDAAGVDHGLEVLHTPYHKARGDHGNPEDTVNDVGIYLTTEMAQRVTHLTSKDRTRSRFTRPHLEEGSFGRRSWYWMAALGEVKSFRSPMCAFNMIPRSLPLHQVGAAPSQASNDEPLLFQLPPANPKDMEATSSATAESTSVASRVISVGEPYIKESHKAEHGLGQLAEYMHNFLIHQHRCFAYGFYVQWKHARLLYFDRTGALVSEPFDWTVSTSLLHDFIWKVAHMTPEELGYDPTAQLASGSEIELLRSKMAGGDFDSLPAEVQAYVTKSFRCKATQQPEVETTAEPGDPAATPSEKPPKAKKPAPPLDEVPIYKLTVTSSNPSPDEVFPDTPVSSTTSAGAGGANAIRERSFLVGRPHFAADSLIGRCTRGYIALDLETKLFCFLKDSWRPAVPGRSRPEHIVYERLRDRQVVHIATLVCGGDVGGHHAQVTLVQNHMPLEKKPVGRVHYRIVIKEIGIPLTEFRTFTELAGIFGQALAAHMSAWEFTDILHRDISVGNILINPETREGILIDWDLSRLGRELGNGPMEPDRTGTWQFRSALSLYYLRKPYRLSDDVESFVHAFNYMVLRYHPTWLPGLRTHVQTYFEHSAKAGPYRIGGQMKMAFFEKEWASFRVKNNPKLQGLLDNIAKRCFHEFYKLLDGDLMQRKYGIPTAQDQDQQSEDDEPSPLSNAADAGLISQFRHLLIPEPSSSTSPGLNVDACDIKGGFLSHQIHLLAIFQGFKTGLRDKHEDQFIARASEDPARMPPSTPALGISRMSRSQTQDPSGSSHVASASVAQTAPSTAPTSPPPSAPAPGSGVASAASADEPPPAPSTSTRTLRKRKQKDVKAAEGAVVNNGTGISKGPSSSSPKQKPKRQRKARS